MQSLINDKEEKLKKHSFNIHDQLINYITSEKIPKNTRMKDRQSMSYSIELRMPFLDHRIIELGLSLDENFTSKEDIQKYYKRSNEK